MVVEVVCNQMPTRTKEETIVAVVAVVCTNPVEVTTTEDLPVATPHKVHLEVTQKFTKAVVVTSAQHRLLPIQLRQLWAQVWLPLKTIWVPKWSSKVGVVWDVNHFCFAITSNVCVQLMFSCFHDCPEFQQTLNNSGIGLGANLAPTLPSIGFSSPRLPESSCPCRFIHFHFENCKL